MLLIRGLLDIFPFSELQKSRLMLYKTNNECFSFLRWYSYLHYRCTHNHSLFVYYYPYRAFGGQNEIVLCDGGKNNIIAQAIISLLPGLHVTNHLTLIYVYDLS